MSRHPQITGAILAGGLATRMGGGEKGLVELEGRSFLDRVVDALSEVFDEILVVTPRPDPLVAADGWTIVEDFYEQAGPLGGIHAALAASSQPHVFVAGCDMPLIDPRVVSAIATHAHAADVVMPRIDHRDQPLHAVYDKAVTGRVDHLLRMGKRSVQDLLERSHVHFVPDSEICEIEGCADSFLNVNTPEDLERAARILRARESAGAEQGDRSGASYRANS